MFNVFVCQNFGFIEVMKRKISKYTGTLTLRTHLFPVFNMESETGNYIYSTNGEIKLMLL
jgi:hypothetical protein